MRVPSSEAPVTEFASLKARNNHVEEAIKVWETKPYPFARCLPFPSQVAAAHEFNISAPRLRLVCVYYLSNCFDTNRRVQASEAAWQARRKAASSIIAIVVIVAQTANVVNDFRREYEDAPRKVSFWFSNSI
jgi:hypothetical protein